MVSLSDTLYGLLLDSSLSRHMRRGPYGYSKETKMENQWLVVLYLSASMIREMDNKEYGCQWEGSAGLIKVVPSYVHDMTTDSVTRLMDGKINTMGFWGIDRAWVAKTTYELTPAQGSQRDQGFLPPQKLK